jgi:type IV pilus assembly protein PilB
MINNAGKRIDMRVSILPVVGGEKIVIRVMDGSTNTRKLEEFGFHPQVLKELRQCLRAPHGIILVTGPTGSGKSSTLYASLGELNRPEVNIITIEDPVEFQMEGLNQVAVNNKVGLTFASGLRSILRQDPNVIMVGEIRDGETAEISIRAAMTGHMVLSTLHTNDSVSSINRLIDMGVEPFLVANALSGVIAQRLVKKTCEDCRVKIKISVGEHRFIRQYGIDQNFLYEGRGCSKCDGTGFRGRIAVQEFLVITPEIRRMIMNQDESDQIMEYAKSQNMRFMMNDAVDKVARGLTTLTEVVKSVMTEH